MAIAQKYGITVIEDAAEGMGSRFNGQVLGIHMHKQPVYAGAPVYTNGVEEEMFKVGFCLPAGPYVTDEDVHYIVDCIKGAIVK